MLGDADGGKLLRSIIEQVHQLQADLHRSNALLEAVQATAIDGIAIVDQDRRIVSYNQQFCKIWRIPEATVQASELQQLLQLVRDRMPQTEEFWARVEFIYQYPDLTSRDEIVLQDGRSLDR